MKKIFIMWTLLCLIVDIGSAQNRHSNRIDGYIYEEGEDRPLHFATVQLLSSDSTYLAGTTSDSNGYFCMDLPADKGCILSVSYIGYCTIFIPVLADVEIKTIQVQMKQLDAILDEVTVQANSIVMRTDHRTIIPNKEQMRMATDGVDLLRKINLPGIIINPYTEEIGTYGNGKVILCINGVKVTSAEITAIPVADILKIDYYDNPGVRYGEADAVINYITKRRNSGGNLNGDFFNCFGDGKNAVIDHLSLKHNQGKSEWSANMGFFMLNRNNWIRDYDEMRTYPEGKVHRQEMGSPVAIGQTGFRGSLNYSFADEDKYFLNIQFNHAFTDIPNSEEGDRKTVLLESDMDVPVSVYEHMTETSNSPSLNVYFQKKISGNRQFIFDVTGTYIRTCNQRIYREGMSDDIITDVFSDINGDKYSLIAEGVYESRTNYNILTSGIRHVHSYMNNKYAGTISGNVSMHQAESSLYVELQHKKEKWGYMGNMTLSRIYYSQNYVHLERFSVQPSVRFNFIPIDKVYFKCISDLKTASPSLAAMNDVEQSIEQGMVCRGNPNLHTFCVMNHKINVGYNGKIINVDLSVGYKHEFNPIMESVLYENQRFVRTYQNQKAFQQLSAEATISFRPWEKHLCISFAPIANRFISKGNAYLHTYTMLRFLWNIDFVFKNWTASYNTLMGPANTMYGERLTEEKNMNMLLVGYKHPKWSLKMGVFNPFMKEYWMETHDWSALTTSVSRAHCRKNMYFVMKLNFNLNYGRQIQHNHKQVNNEDTDAGIMQGTKK